MDKLEVRSLRVDLTAEEKGKMGEDLAEILGKIDETTQDMKAFLAEKKAHIESLMAQRQFLVLTLNRGYEFRDVEIQLQKNFEANEVTVIRTDTGEVIETRALTFQERDQELALITDLNKRKRGQGPGDLPGPVIINPVES